MARWSFYAIDFLVSSHKTLVNRVFSIRAGHLAQIPGKFLVGIFRFGVFRPQQIPESRVRVDGVEAFADLSVNGSATAPRAASAFWLLRLALLTLAGVFFRKKIKSS